ncbi:sigma-70 family RNA polymerase sigma factor [Bradyrhizobium roseum]|uniref:sigma-70 family RNA polymerase sigma factor n=1 Tax=Bradyrhizobium roseum TaxID=3056648 RepID=UPI0026130558|nr:sigma-70 family RNA polymerase sigma factor [Bradyrhizobium roseus]WKA30419.1 sigma-70 family RNA polymerase sigma factor [Bradyrhizobium roseus]
MLAARSHPTQLQLLLLRMSRKDEAAFEKLYSATKRKLFSTVLLIVKRRHLAEEILQEAYVRIWLNAAAYRSSLGSPMNWMTTIAKNLAIDVARKPAREIHSDHSAMLNFPADSPTALETIEIRESESETIRLQRSICFALQALGPLRRQLVIAAYIHGESRHRLSEQYGVPVSTIKTWIRRALLDVRASVGAPANYSDINLLISDLVVSSQHNLIVGANEVIRRS